MARKQRQRIGEILVKWGVVTPAGVEEALQHARAEGLRLGEALVALGLVLSLGLLGAATGLR